MDIYILSSTEIPARDSTNSSLNRTFFRYSGYTTHPWQRCVGVALVTRERTALGNSRRPGNNPAAFRTLSFSTSPDEPTEHLFTPTRQPPPPASNKSVARGASPAVAACSSATLSPISSTASVLPLSAHRGQRAFPWTPEDTL